MTLKEIYNNVKNGAVYGYEFNGEKRYSIYLGEGSDGKGWYKDYIFIEHFGRWASNVNFKEFCSAFTVAWKSANEFMKDHKILD